MPTRREFIHATALGASAMAAGGLPMPTNAAEATPTKPHPLLTAAEDFYDVSRGTPKPFTLTGDALLQARLTPETWRLELAVDPFTSEQVKEPASLERQLTLDDGTALDLPGLMRLAEKRRVRY